MDIKDAKIMDANGDKMNINDFYKLLSITDDYVEGLSVKDNASQEIKNVFSVVDSKGNKIEDTSKVIDSISSGIQNSETPVAIDVIIESTHSGINTNHFHYKSDSMIEDCKTFLAPFHKPLLKNHDSYEEPLGRITESVFTESEIVEGKDTIEVTCRVTDKDAMVKFIDGRYSTVSISGNPKQVACGVCGQYILKDGVVNFCGHMRGKIYNGERATWVCSGIEYDELSVVNKPADDYAQVKRVVVVTATKDSKGDDKSEPVVKPVDAAITEEDKLIAEILDSKPKDKTAEKETPKADEPDKKTPETKPETKDESNVALEKAIKDLKDMEDQNKQISKKLEALENKYAESETKTTTMLSSLKDTSTQLAMKYKQVCIDTVKTLANVDGVTIDTKNIELKTLDEIRSTIEAAKVIINEKQTNTSIKPVDNPGAPNVKDGFVVVEPTTISASDNKVNEEDALISKLIR